MTFWRGVFGVAALFNFAVGLPLLLQPANFFTLMEQAVPTDLLFVRVAGALIATFGVGYWLAAIDPVANRVAVLLGVIGKPMMPIIMWFYFQAGLVPFNSFAVSLGDVVFVALFVYFLLSVPRGSMMR